MGTSSGTSCVCFGIVGGGWRAEFFLRVARALPERFRVGGMVVRDTDKGRAMEAIWGVPTYRTLDALLDADEYMFVVVSVPWPVTPVLTRELAGRGIPVLAETPPAPNLDGLLALHTLTEQGARVQVAEQYQFQPLHAARLALVRSGRLGMVTQAQVSACHDYHAMSLMRLWLGIGFEEATIRAQAFESPLVAGPDRWGVLPEQETVAASRQVVATLDFGAKLGVYDFTGDQYFSWVRAPRVLIRGQRGEITGDTLRYLVDYRTPVEITLRRVNAGENGNLEGYYLKGILAGDEWVYRNPFAPARLTDDEIAVGTCLERMAAYAAGGPGFYDLAQGSQDHYLGLKIAEAVQSGEPISAVRQPWAG